MQDSTKRIRELEDKVVALEAVLRHERKTRLGDLKAREREVRHLANALCKRGEELRRERLQAADAWRFCREKMAENGLDVYGRPQHQTMPVGQNGVQQKTSFEEYIYHADHATEE